MGRFLKGFRFNLLELLGKFGGKEREKRLVTKELKRDLEVWKKFALEAARGLPLAEIFEAPPLFPLTFISDAAGAAFEKHARKLVNVSKRGDRGVASVGYEDGSVNFAAVVRWPHSLLTTERGVHGAAFGSKTTTLEAVRLLLPLLTIPKELGGRHVILEVDNLGVVFGWEKKHTLADLVASILLRALHVVEAFLHCKIHVHHVPRVSTPMALLADKLSRDSTAETVEKDLGPFTHHVPEGALHRWLENPRPNWSLCSEIVADIERML